MRSALCSTASLAAAITAVLMAAGPAMPDSLPSFGCTPAHVWGCGFGAPPRFPFAGDVNADGLADLICVCPPGDCIIDVSLNVSGWKSGVPFQARREFGRDAVCAVGGEFGGSKGTDVLALMAGGEIRLAYDYDPGKRCYTRDAVVAQFAGDTSRPALIASGDVDGDGLDEAVIVEDSGRAHLLQLSGEPRLGSCLVSIGSLGRGVRAIALARWGGGRSGTLACIDRDGVLWAIDIAGDRLGKRTRLLRARPDDPLTTGDLDGNGLDELVCGTRVLWNGDAGTVTEWPELADIGPGILCTGDVNGDGRADIIRYRRGAREPGREPYTANDILVYFTYRTDLDPTSSGPFGGDKIALSTDPLEMDADGDGLLDIWETRGVRGLDLPAMGCDPLRKDVICYIQPLGLKPEEIERLKTEFESIGAFYRGLWMRNPDGTYGINIIPIFRESIPKAEGKGWRDYARETFPAEHKGVAHWMLVYKGGGGQSSQMGDAGQCGSGAFCATFIHEFGHQLGLDHTGFWGPLHAPTYTSMMNYAYNYSFDERGGAVHYSRGALAGLRLDENNLSEVLPYPLKAVEFLGKRPYRYRLKADGARTLIDWNWNGVFGEEHVRADINYAYCTSAGDTHTIGKSLTAPLLIAHNDEDLLLFYGITPLPGPTPATAEQTKALTSSEPMSLVFRGYRGGREWGEPTVIEEEALAGDPTGVSDGRCVWVFYPTAEGVRHITLTRSGGQWKAGGGRLVPDSAGMQATPCVYGGGIVLLLWQGPENEVQYRWREEGGWSEAGSLGFRSTFPPGAAVDTVNNELVVVVGQDHDESRQSRWQLRRFAAEGDALSPTDVLWVEGENGRMRGSSRPNVIFETGANAGPEGRIRIMGAGLLSEDRPWTGMWSAEQVADQSVNEGWLVKRVYNEWAETRSAPAAAWFRGDIVFAYRWVENWGRDIDNDLMLAYSGLGIDPDPMGDHDDVGFIDKVGLQRSILWMNE